MSAILLAVDAGTTSSRCMGFDLQGNVIAMSQAAHDQVYPKAGWVEHKGEELYSCVAECMEGVAEKLGAKVKQVAGLGITNQRETTIVWDKTTGKPLHNAIVWLDTRTATTVTELCGESGDKDRFREGCGLPLSTYFSGTKLKWLLDNSEEVQQAVKEDKALFGTVDTWLIWNLTGGVNGGVHVTDVTNASRTMLMNISTLEWDEGLCKEFGVPKSILPVIKSSAEVYGHVADGPFKGLPIASCLGDQHAACIGQGVRAEGQVKNTYGTGCFMLMNTGKSPTPSSHGLLTTVCYQLGKDAAPTYALEGSVAIAGAAIQWLRDNMGIIKKSEEVGARAATVEDCGGVTFVPAFSGLFAPHWRSDARGVIVGLTGYTTSAHICRAVLEAICFQTCDILEAMQNDSGIKLELLRVDGGVTSSELCMQTQADLLGVPVARPAMTEMTALGAAMAAGLATGVFASADEMWAVAEGVPSSSFNPTIEQKERVERRSKWTDAVQRTHNLA